MENDKYSIRQLYVHILKIILWGEKFEVCCEKMSVVLHNIVER